MTAAPDSGQSQLKQQQRQQTQTVGDSQGIDQKLNQ